MIMILMPVNLAFSSVTHTATRNPMIDRAGSHSLCQEVCLSGERSRSMNDASSTNMSQPQSTGSVTEAFRAARDALLQHRTDYDTAIHNFSWPTFDHFNWALDWFDRTGSDAGSMDRPA